MTHKETPPIFSCPGRGLLDSLRSAMTEDEIKIILQMGDDYIYATDRTRSRWHQAAKKRRRELAC